MFLRRQTILRLYLLPGVVCAALLWNVNAVNAEPTVALTDVGDGAYELDGQFKIAATQKAIWDVLTDYAGIPSFVDSMKESRVQEREHDHILVEQVAVGRLFLFSKQVRLVLRVDEKPMTQIRFEDVSHNDFTYYKGSWEIRQSDAGYDVLYRLGCHRRFSIPNGWAKKVMKRDAENLLTQVKQEIIRRTEGIPK